MWKKVLKSIPGAKSINSMLLQKRIQNQFLRLNQTEQSQLAFYSQFISKRDLVFDVGANVGSRSKLFLNLGAKVIAFEPQPELCEHLTQHLRNHTRFTLMPIGLGLNTSVVKLRISDAHVLSSMSERWINATKNSGRFIEYNWDTKINVDISTLDLEIARHGVPTYVKIDVEGYELEVLKGLSKPINFISIEFTEEDIQQSIACMDKLDKLGNYQYNFSDGETHFFENDKWFTKNQLVDFLNSKKEKKSHLWGDIFCKLT